jgi:hypothetical protein
MGSHAFYLQNKKTGPFHPSWCWKTSPPEAQSPSQTQSINKGKDQKVRQDGGQNNVGEKAAGRGGRKAGKRFLAFLEVKMIKRELKKM